MADGVTITPGTGATIATDDIAGQQYQRVKVVLGADGVNDGDVSSSNALPVSGPLTDAELRATAVPVFGTVTISDGSGPVTVDGTVAVSGTVAVNQSGVSATGSLTGNNQDVALSLSGSSGWAVDLRGTFTATVTFQGTIDGTNWFTIAVVPAGGTVSVASVTTATAAGAWWGNATGLQQVRARTTAYTSGTITVVIRAMQAAGVVSALVTGATTTPVSGTVTAGISAGTNAIGDVGIQYRANATGAATVTNVLSPATPAAQVIKASAGRLLGFCLVNVNAATRWLKVFNATTATLGTTSATFELALPPNQCVRMEFPGGLAMGTGITIAITGGQGLTNNTAITASEITGFTAHA